MHSTQFIKSSFFTKTHSYKKKENTKNFSGEFVENVFILKFEWQPYAPLSEIRHAPWVRKVCKFIDQVKEKTIFAEKEDAERSQMTFYRMPSMNNTSTHYTRHTYMHIHLTWGRQMNCVFHMHNAHIQLHSQKYYICKQKFIDAQIIAAATNQSFRIEYLHWFTQIVPQSIA